MDMDLKNILEGVVIVSAIPLLTNWAIAHYRCNVALEELFEREGPDADTNKVPNYFRYVLDVKANIKYIPKVISKLIEK
jgi:hypothetical protein